jgi:hypothetical protein
MDQNDAVSEDENVTTYKSYNQRDHSDYKKLQNRIFQTVDELY